MKDEIQMKLDEVIVQEIEGIKRLPNGKERNAAVESLRKLCGLRINEIKVEQAKIESQNKEVESDRTWTNQVAQLRQQKIDRWVNVALQLAVTFGGIAAYNAWFNRGLRFEIDNTITNPWTKGLLSRMIPNKK